ncbi:MAG: hypothetical protein FWB97_01820 [Oscillospiraceae bacterium]|nr:hypothetical protein [Oscillospiraceae bacterium]
MPDKQNENKFMAMLERKGIVRKADVEDEQGEVAQKDSQSRPEADLRSIFGAPDVRPQNVTPAPRQPVPGMMNPSIPTPAEKPTERPAERPSENTWAPQRPAERVVQIERQVVPYDRLERPTPVEADDPMPVATAEIRLKHPVSEEYSRQGPHYTAVDPFKEEPKDITSAASPVAVEPYSYERPEQQPQQPMPPAENITERYLDVDELYEALSLQTKRTDTIYLIEEYTKTLPDSLPEESRRDIVGKIVSASGFDYDLLMGDGVLRVKKLKEYAERFAQHTEEYVSARQAELDELDRQILAIRKMIENRRELHKKQFFTIEAEAQRLKEILTFISG